ncbi:N-acetyltransferase [Elusimicrobiota bacterium]
MRKEVPVKVSQEQITFDVEELEPILCGPAMNLPPFEPAYVELKDGKKMLIRKLEKEEAPLILDIIRPMIEKADDFYDIVGVRVYAEILGWLRNRLKDPFQLIGIVEGEIAGFCNGRMMNDDIAISLHTMAYKRGLRAGAVLYYAKAQYAFDALGAKEWWSTFESYNGLKRWGIGMAQPSYPWPEYQHELGGATVYYITDEYWNSDVKNYITEMIGGDLIRPVPEDLLKANETLALPSE